MDNAKHTAADAKLCRAQIHTANPVPKQQKMRTKAKEQAHPSTARILRQPINDQQRLHGQWKQQWAEENPQQRSAVIANTQALTVNAAIGKARDQIDRNKQKQQ